MTRDDLAPIGADEHPGFPCPKCDGSGAVPCGGVRVRCFDCGGSGRSLDVPPEFSAANPANLARMDTK